MNTPYSSKVLGIGAISAFGDSLQTLAQAVKEQRSPQTTKKTITSFDGSFELDVLKVPNFKLLKQLPPATERRLGSLSRLCFQAILRAIEDANLKMEDPSRVGLIIGTAHGASEVDSKYFTRLSGDGRAFASPTLFTNSVHNSISSFISLNLGISGPSTTVVNLELSTAAAIELANAWLNEDRVDTVLVAVGDGHFDKQIHSHHHRVGSQDAPSNQEALNKTLFSEGAVGLVLSNKNESGENLLNLKATTNSHLKNIEAPSLLIANKNTEHFPSVLAKHSKLISYETQCGFYTSSGGLDLAIAHHGLREHRIYPSTSPSEGRDTSLEDGFLDVHSVDLLQVAREHEVGWVQLFH